MKPETRGDVFKNTMPHNNEIAAFILSTIKSGHEGNRDALKR